MKEYSILSDEVFLELNRLSVISSTHLRTILLAAFASLVHRNSNDTEVRIAASGSVEGTERIQSTQFTPICIDFLTIQVLNKFWRQTERDLKESQWRVGERVRILFAR